MREKPTYDDLVKKVQDLEREISERESLEEVLGRSEAKYRSILENIKDEYYEIDLEGKYTFVNQAVCNNQGLAREELIGTHSQDHMSPEEGKRLFKILVNVYQTGNPANLINYEVVRKDGRKMFFEDSISLLRDGKGIPNGFAGIARNITEKKKSQEALARSEKEYRTILEMSPDAISITVIETGNFLMVNEAFCRLSGYQEKELLGRPPEDLNLYAGPADRERLLAALGETGRANGVEIQYRTKNGIIKDFLFSSRIVRYQGEDCLLFVGTVITPLKEAQRALKESEEKYRNILDNMEEVYYEVDLSGNLTFFNPAMCISFGRTPEEMMGMNYREYTSPEGAGLLFSVFNEVFRTGIPNQLFDFPIIRIDGVVRALEGSVSLLLNASGEPIGFRGMIRDRTDQKKAETALQQSEEKYRLLVENAHDGIYILQDGVLKFTNAKIETLTGYGMEELSKMTFTDLVHSNDQSAVTGRLRQPTGKERMAVPFSFRIINKGNEIRWVEWNSVEIVWEGRPGSLNFLRDITPQKKMEAQFLQAQKMEAVGTLAGGMAHDFNNLLMGIQGNTSLILVDINSDHPHYSKLKGIEQQVQAGAELTRQLLGAARGGKYEARATNINQLIERGLDLFARTKKEIRVHKYFSEEIRTVEVDRSQIEQVLLNLYVNAGHAMPGGGDLYVETKNIRLDEIYTRSYDLTPGNFVRISVTDTGVGMDETTQKRAFDPFFTTREMGRGTGLGLASAYGIIRNHNGIINIYSEKGEGTTFNIYLPVTEKKIVDQPEIPETILRGTESVLFVDDEEAISLIGKRLLERLGYRVLTARSGQEALDHYREEGEGLDLVILDMIMPGLNGGETFDRLKGLNPSVKVILSSGYSINGQAKTILDRGCQGFLQKPFSLVDLSKKVRQVLDSPKKKGR